MDANHGDDIQLRLARAEAAWSEARSRETTLLALFDELDAGLAVQELIYDEHGTIVDVIYRQVNAAFERQGGLHDAVDRSIFEMLSGVEAYWLEHYRQAARTDRPIRVENYQQDVGRWFEVQFSRLDPEGRFIATVFRDISERKRVDGALRESEARHRSLLGSLAQAVWEADAHGLVNEDSPSWCAYTGQSLDEFLGYGWLNAIHPDDRPYAERQWREAVAAGRLVDAQFRLRTPNGGWRWTNVRATPLLDADGRIEKWAGMNIDIHERKRAEAVLLANEEQQGFLLKFSDALRAEPSVERVAQAAVDMIAAHLRLDRCYVSQTGSAMDTGRIEQEFHRHDLASIAGEPRDTEAVRIIRRTRDAPVVIADTGREPSFSASQKAGLLRIGIGSLLSIPIRHAGTEIIRALNAATVGARDWTDGDRRLMQDAGERTWAAVERARTDVVQRESEERFAQFAASSSGALWIRDAATLEMEYTSPAIETIYGIPPDAILGDVRRWASHIVPEDRERALSHLEQARQDNAVTHEFRILRASDGAFRWIRNTDFPLRDDQGRVQRIGGIAQDVTDAKQAAEHQTVLLLELQHRVRNILAIVRSMADRTGDTAESVEDYRDRLTGRLRALAHVQVLLTRSANAGVDLATLIRAEVEVQAGHEGQFALSGPELLLSPKAAEVLTLAIHELTTNALKYGALAQAAGSLRVTWQIEHESNEPWLRLEWREMKGGGLNGQPARRGFGTTLIEERIPYELDGCGGLHFEASGLVCRMTFPLRGGDSILKTDAVPLAATIEGGSLDMKGEADLSGCRVLVIEDDFYLAADTARALRKARATVFGPVGKEDQALALIAEQPADCALVDINVGNGLQFEVADAMREKGVPFVFVTGYDDVMIPPRFDDIQRIRKPADFRQIVRAIAGMCHSRS